MTDFSISNIMKTLRLFSTIEGYYRDLYTMDRKNIRIIYKIILLFTIGLFICFSWGKCSKRIKVLLIIIIFMLFNFSLIIKVFDINLTANLEKDCNLTKKELLCTKYFLTKNDTGYSWFIKYMKMDCNIYKEILVRKYFFDEIFKVHMDDHKLALRNYYKKSYYSQEDLQIFFDVNNSFTACYDNMIYIFNGKSFFYLIDNYEFKEEDNHYYVNDKPISQLPFNLRYNIKISGKDIYINSKKVMQ